MPILKALFTRQRIAQCAMLVFVFQVAVVGLCMPTASATETPIMQDTQAPMHCLASSSMANMQHDNEVVEHACSHCDLPDLVFNADKASLVDAALYVILTYADTAIVSATTTTLAPAVHFSSQLRTSLLTYNLNLRFRV